MWRSGARMAVGSRGLRDRWTSRVPGCVKVFLRPGRVPALAF